MKGAFAVIVTNTGVYPCPPEIIRAFRAAPKRRDHRPDRRFRVTREALRLEADFIAQDDAAYAAKDKIDA